MLLQVDQLKTYFYTRNGVVKAVDGVSFDLVEGETLGIVGESGSGKTVTGLSLTRLIPQPPGRVVDGQVVFGGQDLLKLTDDEIRKVRGKLISMICQDPMTSLNPVLTLGSVSSAAWSIASKPRATPFPRNPPQPSGPHGMGIFMAGVVA